eukprot:s253_g8.t1
MLGNQEEARFARDIHWRSWKDKRELYPQSPIPWRSVDSEACVLAQGGCNWNMEKGICELNPTGGTACIACPRQYFCSTPRIRTKSPQNLAIMGSEEVGWLINISFDREMEFMHIGIGSGVLLQCRPVRPGDWPPTFEEIDGTMLHINVFGLPNDENRDCDVVITDTAVRGVDALLPFNGLPDNEMFVTLPDGIPPQVNSFMPGNSAVSVPIDPIVRFFFDEKIKVWRESNIGVYTLGGNQSDREADKLIAELSIWSAAVTIDQDTLIVDLSGILSTSTYYSVSIPIGAVSDLSNNPFPGIARGVYMFQTGADERVETLQDTTEDDTLMHTIIIVVAGCLVGIVALAAAYMACEKVHKVRRRARVVARKETMEVNIEKVDIEKPQLPHLNHDPDDDDGWPMEHMPTSPAAPGSPSSQSPLASSIRRASSEKIKVPRSPTSRPNVQVFSKPEELKTQVHTQLRNAGTVVSLADYHNKSSQMMRTIGGKVDDRKRRPGGASTAPSSPVAGRRHSAMPQGVPRLVEGNPGARRLQSAEGGEIIHSLQTRCTSGTWSYDNVKYNISAGIAQVKLDEPRTGNALKLGGKVGNWRHKTVSALLDICVELHGRPDVKAVVFTASGFYFSTGGETPEDESDFAPRMEPGLQRKVEVNDPLATCSGASRFETAVAENLPIAHLLYLMSTLPQYKVAAIRGSIMGAGISLVAAMDYVVAPESRTQLSFKEATRGLGACCSWQATVAKLGVMKMRQLCLLAEDVNANQAKELKLVDHIVTGAAKDAFIEADALALAKAKEVARKCLDERQGLKTTGPVQRKPLLQLAGCKDPIEAYLVEVTKRHGLEPRCPVYRFSNQLWPYEAVQLEIVGQHMARRANLRTSSSQLDGLLTALLELHRTAPGQVRLVELCCETPLEGFDDVKFQDALALLRMLPQVLLGRPPAEGQGLQLLLWAQCDVVLVTSEVSFEVPEGWDFPGEVAPGSIDVFTAKESRCEKLSECAPNAVAQAKGFIHKIGSTPMCPDVLQELAGHVARRTEDPEFEDSIRALWDKAHVPIYRRPGHRVVTGLCILRPAADQHAAQPPSLSAMLARVFLLSLQLIACRVALEVEVSVEAAWPAASLAAELLEGLSHLDRGAAFLRTLAEAVGFLRDATPQVSTLQVDVEKAKFQQRAVEIAEQLLCCQGQSIYGRLLSLRARHAFASAVVEAARGMERADRAALEEQNLLNPQSCAIGEPWILLQSPRSFRVLCGEEVAKLADLVFQDGSEGIASGQRGAPRQSGLDHVLYDSSDLQNDTADAWRDQTRSCERLCFFPQAYDVDERKPNRMYA